MKSRGKVVMISFADHDAHLYAARIGLNSRHIADLGLEGYANLRVRSVPTVLLVNSQGKILVHHEGAPGVDEQAKIFGAISERRPRS